MYIDAIGYNSYTPMHIPDSYFKEAGHPSYRIRKFFRDRENLIETLIKISENDSLFKIFNFITRKQITSFSKNFQILELLREIFKISLKSLKRY